MLTAEKVSPALLLYGAMLLVVSMAVLVSPLVAMAMCLVALGIWVLVERPMAIVALAVVVIFSNAADIATDRYGSPPIMWILVPALAGAVLVRISFGREDLTGALLVLPLLGIYLFGRALSLLSVSDLGPSTTEFIGVAKDTLITLVLAAFLTSMRRVNLVVASAAASIGVLALLSTVQYLTGTFQNDYLGFANAAVRQITVGSADSWRLTGPMPDANYFGQLLVLGLPLVLTYAFGQRPRLIRILAAVGAAAVVFAILVTFSRGALLALVVMGFVGVFSLKRWPIYLIAATTILILGLMLLPAPYQERLAPVWQAAVEITTRGQWIMDPALAQRMSAVAVALSMYASNPLLGIGLGQFPVQYGYYALMSGMDVGAPAEAHNFYLETLAEGGILGLALFVILVGSTLLLGLRARRSLQAKGATNDAILVQGLLFSLVGFLATSMFLHGAYQRFLWIDLALLLSVSLVAQFHHSGERQAHRDGSGAMMTEDDVFGQAIRLVWRWISFVIVFALLGLGLGYYHAKQSPRDFASEQTLLYRFGREYFPVTPGEMRREWGENVPISLDNALFTEMRLLTAHDLFVSTAAIEWPHGVPDQGRDASKPLTATEIAELVARKFTVSRVQSAAMVTISARDPEPARADRLVAGQVAGYLQRRAAMFEKGSARFYDAQIKQAFTVLADLTKQRTGILAKFGLTSADAPNAAAGPIELTLALQPIETQIAAANTNLGLLMSEQAAANVSDEYRKQVMPVVEVVDRMSAEGNPIGLPAWASVVLGALSGIVAALVIIFLWAALRGGQSGRITLPKPEHQRAPSE